MPISELFARADKNNPAELNTKNTNKPDPALRARSIAESTGYRRTPNKYAFWRVVYIIVVGLTIAGVFGISFFIYQNIFAAISNAQIIGILSPALNIDIVDTMSYDKAREMISEKRKQIKIPRELRDIFTFATTSTPNAANKTKK